MTSYYGERSSPGISSWPPTRSSSSTPSMISSSPSLWFAVSPELIVVVVKEVGGVEFTKLRDWELVGLSLVLLRIATNFWKNAIGSCGVLTKGSPWFWELSFSSARASCLALLICLPLFAPKQDCQQLQVPRNVTCGGIVVFIFLNGRCAIVL